MGGGEGGFGRGGGGGGVGVEQLRGWRVLLGSSCRQQLEPGGCKNTAEDQLELGR